MIYLTERDILKAVSVNDVLDAIEASMCVYERREFHMPQRLHVDYQENTLLLMPCFQAVSQLCFMFATSHSNVVSPDTTRPVPPRPTPVSNHLLTQNPTYILISKTTADHPTLQP